jgi:dienelactone hydrolase
VRATYGASLSPDATAFAHIVDDGGYPRAVQRFLRGSRTSSSRDVEFPIQGPVTRVVHSPDGHWLACEVAPHGSTRTQLWVVTTDPDDRDARRIDHWPAGAPEGTAQLVGWDGTLVAAILTGEDGVGSSCLINPDGDGSTIVLDRRSGGKLIDAWKSAALVRVGPRGHRELIMLRGSTEIALLPHDSGSISDVGVILDDHQPRRVRSGPHGEVMKLNRPADDYPLDSTRGYVRALIRSDNGGEHARLIEVTSTEDGVAYHVVAERPGHDLDEFAVSDDLSTVALLWNIHGRSELQILEYADNTLSEPIPLPGPVAGELSISASGSMVAMTVQGPSMPRTVELVDPRSREWERIDREPSGGDASGEPELITIRARDGLDFTCWLYSPSGDESVGALVYLHGGPEGQARPEYSEIFPVLLDAGITVLTPNVRGSGGFGRTFSHADDKELRFAAIDDVADCARFLVDSGLATTGRIACSGWSYGGYLTQAVLTFHPELFAAGISICGMSDLGTFYRNTDPWEAAAAYPKYGHPVNDHELLDRLSPLLRVEALVAPLLLVHGARDTNVPATESRQMFRALRDLGRTVEILEFDDDGHQILKRENRAALVKAIGDWLITAFMPTPDT